MLDIHKSVPHNKNTKRHICVAKIKKKGLYGEWKENVCNGRGMQANIREVTEQFEKTEIKLTPEGLEDIENIINSAKDILEKEQEDSISSKDVNEDWLPL